MMIRKESDDTRMVFDHLSSAIVVYSACSVVKLEVCLFACLLVEAQATEDVHFIGIIVTSCLVLRLLYCTRTYCGCNTSLFEVSDKLSGMISFSCKSSVPPVRKLSSPRVRLLEGNGSRRTVNSIPNITEESVILW